MTTPSQPQSLSTEAELLELQAAAERSKIDSRMWNQTGEQLAQMRAEMLQIARVAARPWLHSLLHRPLAETTMTRSDSVDVIPGPTPDAVARVLKATEAALYVFGNAPKALRWLSKPNRVLRGRSPSEMVAESEAGMQEVIEEIRRIEHSIYI